MAKIIDKLMGFMKLENYDDQNELDVEVTGDYVQESAHSQSIKDEKREKPKRFSSLSGGKETHPGKVVNFQASVKMEVIVIQPETYAEAQDICDHIKSQRPVIINLEQMDRTVAQRIMDFVSGSCYTLNGELQRITNSIFIIAPENIDVAGDFREELKSQGIILPWQSDE